MSGKPPPVAVVVRALRESSVNPPRLQVAVAQAREILTALKEAGYEL